MELARVQQEYLRWNREVDLLWKRLESADKKRDIIYGLE